MEARLPVQVSIARSKQQSILIILIYFISIVNSPFTTSSITLDIPTFPIQFPFKDYYP